MLVDDSGERGVVVYFFPSLSTECTARRPIKTNDTPQTCLFLPDSLSLSLDSLGVESIIDHICINAQYREDPMNRGEAIRFNFARITAALPNFFSK